ncbi:Glycosyltransferase involved in cell wall bisynthesis [Ferrimonas sediminum]|uniref:Glycosyltransferase involved in cell wall bisynthesis n=1 Tax=Ferrimonas sediminum TaxID=718193 RepID=A0A1G8Z0D4_9GAMM|nr:glycosyltransferase [Ferrimonas sediminum]SDK08491.1 Glycosyltransferase involved in cell wall bisynthesis [Ferrimonas sediminum]
MMVSNKLLLTVERRYLEYNGDYYVKGTEDSAFFDKYLDEFEQVDVLCRVEKTNKLPVGYQLVCRENLSMVPIYTTGVGVFKAFCILRILSKYKCQRIIIRTPGMLAYAVSLYCYLINAKFFCEVVADPFQEAKSVSENVIVRTILKFVLPRIFSFQMKKCCLASFVTEREIQSATLGKNQIKSDKFDYQYSSISIEDDFYYNSKQVDGESDVIRLLFVGVLDRPFKGLDIFLKMVALLPQNYHGIIVGDGVLLDEYKDLSTKLGIRNRVSFKGYISDKETKLDIYRMADIFVLTSRREGLPRVVIEAMANSLPCICSRVSGVSELIEDKYIFNIDDFEGAHKLILSLSNEECDYMSKNNFSNSQKYNITKLSEKRKEFFEDVKEYC